MADNTDWNEQAGKVGVGLAIVGALIGYSVNGGGGALLGAVAGFGIGAAIVRALQGLGYIIVGGLMLLAAYAGFNTAWSRLGKAASPAPAPTIAVDPQPAPTIQIMPPTASTPTAAPSASPSRGGATETPSGRASAGWPVEVENGCSKEVRVFLKWRDPDLGWRTEGAWHVAGNSRQTLGLTGGNNLRADYRDIYFYAYTPDHDEEWTGSYPAQYKGRTLPMAMAVVGGFTRYSFRIDCHGR